MSLTRFLIRIISFRLLVFYLLLTLTFIIPRLMPGGAFAYLLENPNVTPEMREALIKAYGLDQPLYLQYYIFLKKLFFEGDIGVSYTYKRPVLDVILEALPWTLILVTTSIILSFTIGVPLGVWLAFNRDTRAGVSISGLLFIIRSIPGFWLGLLMLIVFGYHMGIAPLYGAYTYGITYNNVYEWIADVIAHMWLPILTLVLLVLPFPAIYTRNAVVDVMEEDFVKTAKAKGLPETKVMLKHALRPASLPVVTLFALELGTSVGGALLIEIIFSLPGMGKLFYDSIYTSDYPLLLGIVIFVSAVTLALITIVEILYAVIDPRVRMR
jgi:peptide/nickel transport system permease protein